MKRLLIILFFLINLKCYSQRIICHPTTDPKECVLAYIALKTEIKDSNVLVLFNPITPLYESFDGVTWKYNNNLYHISINIMLEDERLRLWTIFHEVGHVIDLYNKDLEQHPLKWKGKEISDNLPWQDRPWEKSADEWANKLWEKFIGDIPPAHTNLNVIDIKTKKKISCIKH